MTQTTEERTDAARGLAMEAFKKLDVTAHSNLTDLIAAIASIDIAMAIVIDDIPVAWGTKTIKQAFIDNLPNPFQANATSSEKAMALALWAMEEAGVI